MQITKMFQSHRDPYQSEVTYKCGTNAACAYNSPGNIFAMIDNSYSHFYFYY
jgi:hypothetical protein